MYRSLWEIGLERTDDEFLRIIFFAGTSFTEFSILVLVEFLESTKKFTPGRFSFYCFSTELLCTPIQIAEPGTTQVSLRERKKKNQNEVLYTY